MAPSLWSSPHLLHHLQWFSYLFGVIHSPILLFASSWKSHGMTDAAQQLHGRKDAPMQDCFLIPTLITSDVQRSRFFWWYHPRELADNFMFTFMSKAPRLCAENISGNTILLHNTLLGCVPKCPHVLFFLSWSKPGHIEQQNEQTSLATATATKDAT